MMIRWARTLAYCWEEDPRNPTAPFLHTQLGPWHFQPQKPSLVHQPPQLGIQMTVPLRWTQTEFRNCLRESCRSATTATEALRLEDSSKPPQAENSSHFTGKKCYLKAYRTCGARKQSHVFRSKFLQLVYQFPTKAHTEKVNLVTWRLNWLLPLWVILMILVLFKTEYWWQ